jgi:signal transduction histidine kinase
MVDLASRNCTRLMSIVNDLLDFTRISSGRFSLDRTTIDIEPILEQVVQNKRIAPNPRLKSKALAASFSGQRRFTRQGNHTGGNYNVCRSEAYHLCRG